MSATPTGRRPRWLGRPLLFDLALAGVAAALSFELGAPGVQAIIFAYENGLASGPPGR